MRFLSASPSSRVWSAWRGALPRSTTTSRSAVAVIVRAVSEPLALYSAASRAHSLCIRLNTFSEIWRDRSSATDSHIDGGDAEVATFLVHVRADPDHEIGAFVAHDFGHVRAQHPPISLQLFEAMRYAAQESLTATPVARMRLSCTPVSSTGTIPSVSYSKPMI